MSMTLEEAIEHAEDTAKSAIGCECREEHRQLAEWLKELQERRKSDNEIPFGNSSFSDLDSIINAYEMHGNHKKVVELLKELAERRKQPEIILCGECKHYKIDHPKSNGYHCCYRCHNIFPMKETDFCSRAERRTE